MDLKTLQKLSYGMYIVSAHKGEKLNGQIANTMFQITADPPAIAVSINKQNLTHEYILASNSFAVSIITTEATMPFIGIFGFKSGRDTDKFKDCNFRTGVTGNPIIHNYCLGFVEAEVTGSLDCGTHTVFLGKIADAGIFDDKEPMTYAYYHQVKGGKTQKNAPTYIPPEPKKG
ncbi:MAG: flavin reductase family protein [Elusimicrobiota bacterium]